MVVQNSYLLTERTTALWAVYGHFYHYNRHYHHYHQHVHLKRETNKYEEEICRGKRSQKDIGGALTNLCNNYIYYNILYVIYKLAGLGATKIHSLADNMFAKSYAAYNSLQTTTFEDFRPKKNKLKHIKYICMVHWKNYQGLKLDHTSVWSIGKITRA